jgi:hypothetical protein
MSYDRLDTGNLERNIAAMHLHWVRLLQESTIPLSAYGTFTPVYPDFSVPCKCCFHSIESSGV